MLIPPQVTCYSYHGASLYERLSSFKKQAQSKSIPSAEAISTSNSRSSPIRKLKNLVLSCYGPHGIYSTFYRKARTFRFDTKFDFVISLSTPPASHLLAYFLIQHKHIHTKHWIQIWEDPWYSDAYGLNATKEIFEEERRLLSFAEKVCYVSPLTLRNQQKLYPESAHKMYWQPLPYYYSGDSSALQNFTANTYGYFGDYVPEARNLLPFYEAAKTVNISVNICGNPSNLFASTEHIHIHPRLPLDKLKPIEDNTNVLVFLCNRKGGQIPGKIYQYSATNKTILFILDGTEEEQKILKNYFAPFNRYIFCQNTAEDIARAIREIEHGHLGSVENKPIEDFNPRETIRKILEGSC